MIEVDSNQVTEVNVQLLVATDVFGLPRDWSGRTFPQNWQVSPNIAI